jgi:hypothetical protein
VANDGTPPPVELPWDTPPDHRIVYLIADGAVAKNSVVAPEKLEATLGVQPVNRWDDVVSLDAAQSIDALIIHDSVLSQVNRHWIASAYERGVVIAVFNVYAPELAELVDDNCITKDGFASEPYPGDFYVDRISLYSWPS